MLRNTLTNELIKFDVYDFVKKIERMSLDELTKDYYQEKARIDKFWYREKGNYWVLNFIRLRDTNIPNRGYIDRESESIELKEDEFLSEEVNAIYDCSLEVLMLQRNIHSLSIKGIQEYITKIIDNPYIKVELIPILRKDALEKLYNAKNYKKISVKFANVKDKYLHTDAKTCLGNIFGICNSWNGYCGELSIGIGRCKNESLDKHAVKDALLDIDNNREIISKALVVIETEDNKVDTVDLFEDTMQDVVVAVLAKRVSLASEYIEKLMLDKFISRKGEIYEILEGRGD